VDNDDEGTVNGLCFSQPVHPDHMLLSTQMQCTQTGSSQVKLSFPTQTTNPHTVFSQYTTDFCHGQFQKIFKPTPREATGNSDDMRRGPKSQGKLNWNFQWCGGSKEKPFFVRGMDVSWSGRVI